MTNYDDHWCDKCEQFASFQPCETCGWWYCNDEPGCPGRTNAEFCPNCTYGPVVWKGPPTIIYGSGLAGTPMLKWMRENLPDGNFIPKSMLPRRKPRTN